MMGKQTRVPLVVVVYSDLREGSKEERGVDIADIRA